MFYNYFLFSEEKVYYNCPLVEKGSLKIDQSSCKMSNTGVYCEPKEKYSGKNRPYCEIIYNYSDIIFYSMANNYIFVVFLILVLIKLIYDVSKEKRLNFLHVLLNPISLYRLFSGYYENKDQQTDIEMMENVETTNEPEVVIN